MKRISFAIGLTLLLLPAGAHAKGTNVRTSSAPHGTDAGERWTTLVRITMPGAGPLEGLRPRVVIRRGDTITAFTAEPTGKPGVYRAGVVFPSRGMWRYGVVDGLDRFERGAGRLHGFPPVRIGPNEAELDEPPLPISGEVEEIAAPAALDSPQGQLPPRTYSVATEEDDGGSGMSAAIPVAAIVLGAALLLPAWVRRRRRHA
ncbi:MAG TPA: hypothetical protein VD790_00320 [Thermoleophilaceae bacterium]|nr:hypothetical protein [Thermoleophilaceae bacterium]